MKSDLAWTMLRPGNFMSNSLAWSPTIKTQGVFHQPSGTGRWAAAAYVDALLDLQAGMKAGKMSAVTDTASRMLGRPPASFES